MKFLYIITFCSTSWLGNTPTDGRDTIEIRSVQYVDQSTGVTVSMENLFVCSKDKLYWSLFDQEWQATKVVWNINDNNTGEVRYSINHETARGWVNFDLTNNQAEMELITEVGSLQYLFKLTN